MRASLYAKTRSRFRFPTRTTRSVSEGFFFSGRGPERILIGLAEELGQQTSR